ncbi:MAG: sensor histidine kinase, partial [Terriglobia bacterium]
FLSRGHRAIPLPSPEIVEKAPMIAQLIKELGLDLNAVIRPSPDVVRELAGKRHGVFHVENAVGSPYIPAQEEFVQRYGIKSVLGFGGMLPNGELFAVILFANVTVSAASADRFRSLALDVKSSFSRFSDTNIFNRSRLTPPEARREL